MLEAATELFAQPEGWTIATVERICSLAGVATRSVYEEFGSREGLLMAVYLNIVEQASAQVAAAQVSAGPDIFDRIRLSITAYLGFMTEDPRRARIAHVSMRMAGDWAHTARLASLERLNSRVQGDLDAVAGHEGKHEWNRLSAVVMTGAVNELVAYWAQSQAPPSPAAMTDLIVHWFRSVLDNPPPG